VTVDYFYLQGPAAVPAEYAAWQRAQAHHEQLAMEFLSGDDSAEPDAERAGLEAARLEAVAREAFSVWCRS
jgi:hypothetical protein